MEGDDQLPRIEDQRAPIESHHHDRFDDSPIVYGMAPDGLPSPQLPAAQVDPPLHPDTFVCMADERTFVVERAGPPHRRKPFAPAFEGDQLVPVEEVRLVADDEQRPIWEHVKTGVRAYPIRRACAHYLVQMVGFQGDTEHVDVTRVCTFRRDSEGEPLSLAGTEVLACSARSPQALVSVERIRRFDRKLLEKGERRRAKGEGFDLSKVDEDEKRPHEGVIEED